MTTIAMPSAETPPAPKLLFGHPRGLYVLAGTEFWDRVSFHAMQSLLTLYMAEQLLLPGHVEHVAGFAAFRAAIEGVTGHLSTQALATQIFGLYVGMVGLTPVLGGILGDRLLGRTRTVSLGAILMTFGHIAMAFDRSFLLALALLILGAGCLRGNLPPQVGELYGRDDHRRGVAFQIYGAMVNFGAFLAPLVSGGLAQAYSWHVGFGFAAIGMLAGLVFYLAGQRALPPPVVHAGPRVRLRLTPPEWRAVWLLMLVTPLLGTFWVAQSQVWNTYNLWVRDHLELMVGGFHVPVPWLQALDGLSPFLTLPPMLLFWKWQANRGREPDDFGKLAIGCFIFGASTLWLAAGQFVTDASGRTPILWAVMFHLSSNLGWLYFAPTANAVLSRGAPAPVTATMMGFYSIAVAIGSVVSGRLGGLYETLSPAAFWSLHAAIVGAGGVAILVYGALARERLFGASA